MAQVALDNATIANSTASNHITYRKWEQVGTTSVYCETYDTDGTTCLSYAGGDPIYGWVTYTTNATVTGVVDSSVTNVRINGVAPIINGDNTIETDTYSIPSGEYVSGAHSNSTSGSVTSGNGNNVFFNGVSASVIGSTITTHASTNSTINGGGSTNVFIGG